MLWKYFDIPDYVYNANIYNVDIYNTLKSLVRNEKESFTLYGKIVQEQRYKNFFSKDGQL